LVKVHFRYSIFDFRLPLSRQGGRIRLSLLLLVVMLGCTPAALAATFTASLDRNTISANESATMSLKFEGGLPAEIPAVPNIPGLSFANIGQSSQFNFINGQSSSVVSYNFLVRAAQPGDYTIPALSALVTGKTLTTQPLKLRVVKSGEPTPESEIIGKNAFLKLVASKNDVYLGEVLPLELRLYARQGNFRQPPQLNQDGFTVGKMIQQPVTKTAINNQYYSLLNYKTFVIPAKTGRLLLGPATMVLAVPHPNARVNVFGEIVDWMDVTLTAEGLPIEVRPLPTNNVPADFNGAVGSYSLNLALSTNTVTVGDPITLTVQIGGHGPIESLTLSSPDKWRHFKVYPPITKVETSDPFGLDGTKTFEQAIIPENADMKELPPVTFSFFDPEQKSYRTVMHPATPIIIRPGTSTPAQPTIVVTPIPGSNQPKPATDIVHIKPRLGTLAQIRAPLLQQTWFVALQGVPLLAWLSVVLWRKREESLARNPRLRRRREVAEIIRGGVAELRRLAAANQAEEFFATTFRLVQEQLGERLDLPASAITEAVVEERLRPCGAPEETLTALEEIFQRCNQARYAPEGSSHELASLAPKVASVLRQLQCLNLDEHPD
jgi:hypothetical protein